MSDDGKPQEGQDTENAKEIVKKLANGETDEEHARWKAKHGIMVLEQDHDRIMASTGAATAFELFSDVERLGKERVQNAEDKNALLRLSHDLESAHKPSFEYASDGKEYESGPILAPITWLWGKADFAFLYETLKSQGAISCGPTAFAALFHDKDNNPMPTDLGKLINGSANPRNEAAQRAYSLIQRHKPDPEN
ncbi:MAG: hypothetical protein ACLQVM_25405 [Terriglobia bacterium]